MGEMILADSNYIINYLDDRLSSVAVRKIEHAQIHISIINKIEVLGWSSATIEQDGILQKFIRQCYVHWLDEAIVEKTIQIKKSTRIKLSDAIIAATALTYDLTLYSRNLDDFHQIPQLRLINPHSL